MQCIKTWSYSDEFGDEHTEYIIKYTTDGGHVDVNDDLASYYDREGRLVMTFTNPLERYDFEDKTLALYDGASRLVSTEKVSGHVIFDYNSDTYPYLVDSLTGDIYPLQV